MGRQVILLLPLRVEGHGLTGNDAPFALSASDYSLPTVETKIIASKNYISNGDWDVLPTVGILAATADNLVEKPVHLWGEK